MNAGPAGVKPRGHGGKVARPTLSRPHAEPETHLRPPDPDVSRPSFPRFGGRDTGGLPRPHREPVEEPEPGRPPPTTRDAAAASAAKTSTAASYRASSADRSEVVNRSGVWRAADFGSPGRS
jgi:hypothetical protein